MSGALHIKHMVCNRCIAAVERTLDSMNLDYKRISLGEVEWKKEPSKQELELLEEKLEEQGFELIDDKKSRLINRIKSRVIELVHYTKEHSKVNLSALLSEELHYDYNYLSNLFSEIEGNTIEKFYIDQKIERVKELLVYDELSLNEIADELNYSSVSHLSSQFKKVTGLTPSHFKKIGQMRRKPLDQL